MKKIQLLFLFGVSLFLEGCISSRKNHNEEIVSAPKWIVDQCRWELFPTEVYVSQLAYGDTAQESKEKASANISEYIKSTVVSSASARYFYTEYTQRGTEEKELQQDIHVSSANNLYKLEYTNPYYYEELGQFACVAYINREHAFNFVCPKLEIARKQFPAAYSTALKKESLIDRIIGIKRSQCVLSDFYEVYDFARAILPEKAILYEEIDALASESILKIKEIAASVLITIQGKGDTALLEKSGVITEVSNQFNKMGVVVGSSQNANCIAVVEVRAVITETNTTFQTFPEIYIKILEKGMEKISYAKQLDKVVGFDKDTVIRRSNLALKKEINTSFMEECF